MSNFKAIVVTKTESGQAVALTDFDDKDLMEGDVTFRVEWSTVNTVQYSATLVRG